MAQPLGDEHPLLAAEFLLLEAGDLFDRRVSEAGDGFHIDRVTA
jgi:hypothetical protein